MKSNIRRSTTAFLVGLLLGLGSLTLAAQEYGPPPVKKNQEVQKKQQEAAKKEQLKRDELRKRAAEARRPADGARKLSPAPARRNPQDARRGRVRPDDSKVYGPPPLRGVKGKEYQKPQDPRATGKRGEVLPPLEPLPPGKSGPKIRIDNANHDWGKILQGTDYTHVFKVYNDGDMPLKLLNIKPG